MSEPATSTSRPLPELPAPPSRRWLKLLLASVIFLCGFLAGTGTSVVVIRNRLVNAIHHPEQAPELITNRLRRPLGLTENQAAEVKKVLQKRQVALQEIRRRVQPEVKTQIDLVEKEVAAVLNPEQQATWRALLERLRATWLPPELPAGNSPSS